MIRFFELCFSTETPTSEKKETIMPKSSRYQPDLPRPKPPAAGSTNAELILFQKRLRDTVPHSRQFAEVPVLKATFDWWTTATDRFAAADATLSQLLEQVEPARRSLAKERTRYWLATSTFLGAAGIAFADDRQGLVRLGLTVQEPRRPSCPILRVHPRKGRPGRYIVRWSPVRGAFRYEVERCREPGAPCTRVYGGRDTRHRGQAEVGQVFWFRMRAAGGRTTDWCAPVRYEVV
jgi:hypothetical protein